MALCVSRGRLALVSDNKTKVRLAKEAREAAVTALELEPSNDLAHHLMGRCVAREQGRSTACSWSPSRAPAYPWHRPLSLASGALQPCDSLPAMSCSAPRRPPQVAL